jgi:uncharacterized protein YxjI
VAYCFNSSVDEGVMMQYPLKLRFKLFSFSQQIAVRDAAGNSILYVKQRMFRFREKVEVFTDATLKRKLFDIAADRMIDFSANYSFTAADGQPWGGVRRRGMRSLWSTHYQIMEDGRVDMEIHEESPMKRFIEAILGEIPIIGLFFIYLLNPTYLISDANGKVVLRAVKKPSIFERYFEIEKLQETEADDELRALMALLMMVLLERSRG